VSGKQIKLFLIDGTPGGLTTAEITNWTGHVLTGPRSDIGALLRRDEVHRTGVYLLLGDDEEALGETRCYIGEADVVAARLKHHVGDKEFWDRVIVITSKDANLTKSHGRYLESRLIELATEAGRVTLENGTAPPKPPLPEADISDMDEFLAQLHVVLPVLGVNVIRVRPVAAPSLGPVATAESPIFTLNEPKSLVSARAQQIDGEFTVLEGSTCVASWSRTGAARSTKKSYASYRAHHARLVAEGVIVVNGDLGRFSRDHVFSSPSTAGAIVVGRSCNGRKEWISTDGHTFGTWEARGVPGSAIPSDGRA
jgi:Domain of unknown function (DUF4357)